MSQYYIPAKPTFIDFYDTLRSMGIEVWFTRFNDVVDLSEGATEQAIRHIFEGDAVALNELLERKEL